MVEQAWQAAIRYEGYRQAAREVTSEAILALGLREVVGDRFLLTGIDQIELDYWGNWGRKHFDWREVVSDFRPYLNRFELAIWQDDKLRALAIGRPSGGPDNLTLHFLERCWEDNPLRGWVAQIVTDTADNYARVLEKQWVKLKNPVPEAIAKYQSIGFSIANSPNKNTYYARQVTR